MADGAQILCTNLTHMLHSKKFTDAVIVANDSELAIHQVILAAGSPVFQAMLENPLLEQSTRKIVISDFDNQTIFEMIIYLYGKKPPKFESFTIEENLRIMDIANKYMIKDLMESVINFFKNNLNTSNAITVLVRADLYQLSELKKKIFKFICANEVFYSDKRQFAALQDRQSLLMEVISEVMKYTHKTKAYICNNRNFHCCVHTNLKS